MYHCTVLTTIPTAFNPILLVVGLLSASCAGRGPIPPASPDPSIVNLFADRMVVQEEARLRGADSTALNNRLDSLYTAYHIPPDRLEAVLENYRKDLNMWKRFYDQVAARLDQMQAGSGITPRR